MALKSLHAKITKTVQIEFGFSGAACERAAKANVAIDSNQKEI